MKKTAILTMLLACAILIGGCGSKDEPQESEKSSEKSQQKSENADTTNQKPISGNNQKEPLNVDVAEGEPANGFLWENSYSEIMITGYVGASNNLIIPDTINGKPVTEIDQRAFQSFSKMESIVIPDSCEKIGSDAFRGCDSLKNIQCSKNVEAILTKESEWGYWAEWGYWTDDGEPYRINVSTRIFGERKPSITINGTKYNESYEKYQEYLKDHPPVSGGNGGN